MLTKILSNKLLLTVFLTVTIFQMFVYLINFFDEEIINIYQEYVYFFYFSALYVNLWIIWILIEKFYKLPRFDIANALILVISANMIVLGIVGWFHYDQEFWKSFYMNGFYLLAFWVLLVILQEIWSYLYPKINKDE